MRKKVLSLCLALVMVLALLPATLAADSGDGWSYSNNVLTISSDSAFSTTPYGYLEHAANVKKIEIKKAVTKIGDYAFENFTALEEVDWEKPHQGSQKTTEIGEGSFSGCTSITSMILPQNLHIIGDDAFQGCTSLAEVIVNSSNLTSVGAGAFSGCAPGLTFGGKGDVGAITSSFEEPSITDIRLVLSGEIGIMFILNQSDIAAGNITATYTVGSNTTVKTAVYDADYNAFVCYVNVAQMADKVALTLAYKVNGEDKEYSLDEPWSVEDYINYVISNPFDDEKINTLVYALADLGYYGQKYLKEANSISGYTEVTTYCETYDEFTNYDGLVPATYERVKDLGDNVTKMTFSLSLKDKTELLVYVYTTETVTDVVGGTVEACNGYYKITVSGRGANELSTPVTVSGKAGEGKNAGFSITFSALSYAYGILNNANSSPKAKACAAAIYAYSAAADAL